VSLHTPGVQRDSASQGEPAGGEQPNRRYWVRLNVSPLGWVALLESGESRGTSALGDVLDLSGGGCVMLLFNVPADLLVKGRIISVALRPGPDRLVTCDGTVLGWTETDHGVQVRIAFTSPEPEVRQQIAAIALEARVRLLQISRDDE
jgi:hypothetical protein